MNLAVEARIARRTGFTLDVAFAFETTALGVTGPSGSGKSTLLDLIAGVEPGASVSIGGRDCSHLPMHRRDIGYVMQDAPLFPHLDVRANLRFSPAGVAASVDEIAGLASALGIEALLDRMPRNLSGGERRRVALARAIASRPGLLLLDEPFTGLDSERRSEAMGLVARVRDSYGIPMILVTHREEEAAALTTHTIRLEEGRVKAGPVRNAECGMRNLQNPELGTRNSERNTQAEGRSC